MSEGDVSLIRDEDVLRRMWQQTEDFSRKKEIRAHMYRLREERLRSLYSADPPAAPAAPAARTDAKGCEFTSAQGHVTSFADQNFQSMKSKEVRDAGSPPKEFTYRGQDLKELSNAGWNVESVDKTTDDGHTHVKSVNANIEGKYDVEGGRGQFAAVDHHRQALTEYRDDNTHLKRNETSSNTAAHEQVVRNTDDGTQLSSTTSSSTSTSKYQQVSTKQESVPYVTDNYDLRQYDTNRNEESRQVTRNDQSLRRNDFESGDLVSRKIDYPDDNTRVIVETRCLPDGTRVTSTRREFRAPVVQSSRSEQHQTRSETKSSYSTQQRSDSRESKTTRHVTDNRINDIVDSQRNVDDYDFRKKQVAEYSTQDDDYSQTRNNRNETKINKQVINRSNDDHYQSTQRHTDERYETKINKQIIDHSTTDRSTIDRSTVDRSSVDRSSVDRSTVDRSSVDRSTVDHSNIDRSTTDRPTIDRSTVDHSNIDRSTVNYSTVDRSTVDRSTVDRSTVDRSTVNRSTTDRSTKENDDYSQIKRINQHRPDTKDEPDRRDITPRDISHQDVRETKVRDTEERIHHITRDKKEEIVERKTSSEHQTTYQTDYTQRKISTEWSPSHTAWASTLRADTPSTTRPSTRASSPGSKTFKSSTSSLRSSLSPDKTSRKPSSRGGSPSKVERYSPTRTTTSDKYSSTHSTHSVTDTKTNKFTSPDRKPPHGRSPTRPGYSPDRKPQDGYHKRPSVSPEKKPQDFTKRPSASPERKPGYKTAESYPRGGSPSRPVDRDGTQTSPRQSPERMPSHRTTPSDGYPKTGSLTRRGDKDRTPTGLRQSPERKPGSNASPIVGNPRTGSPTRPVDRDGAPSAPHQIPERQPGDFTQQADLTHPRPSPERSTFNPNKQPNESTPSRLNQSPDRKPGYQQPIAPTEKYPKDSTSRHSISPDRKPGYMKPTASSPTPDTLKSKPLASPDRKSPTKHVPSRSPDRKPQDSNKTTKIKEEHYRFVDEETKLYTRTDREDDVKQTTRTTTVTEDYSHPRDESPSPMKKTPSEDTTDFCQLKSSTSRQPKNGRSPSPHKGPVTFTEDKHYDRVDKTVIDKNTTTYQDMTEHITTLHRLPKDSPTPKKKDLSREPSPTKYGTYDKKKPYEEEETTTPTRDVKDTIPKDKDSPMKKNLPREPSPTKYGTYDKNKSHVEEETVTTTTTKDVKHITHRTPQDKDSPTPITKDLSRESSPSKHRESSPKKYGTYDTKKKHNVEDTITTTTTKDVKYDSLTRREKTRKNIPDLPSSPNKKSPRDSISPSKSAATDTKYKNTTDFLATERTTEEINKKTTTKERPRQLVTPSTSPTRKPKPVEPEPSTGQSSPTTSESGFVYFSSPRQEKTIVTDLDDEKLYSETNTTEEIRTTYQRPETLDVKRSPSPSKIPCRSPSPEKIITPTKTSLPRKSSLKKPATDTNLVSPMEKPPSSFRVSPTDESPISPEYKVIKKDQPSQPESTSPMKSKPPLERRETYEERCMKILGMVDKTDSSSETVVEEIKKLVKNPESTSSSPSVSPCRSPVTSETFPFKNYPTKKEIHDTKSHVTDFITHEKEDTIKTTVTRRDHVPTDKSKTPSRETSPTKLQDIISKTKTIDKCDETTTKYSEDSTTTTVKSKYPSRESPERKPVDKPSYPDKSPKTVSPGRLSQSPDRKPSDTRSSFTPSRPQHSDTDATRPSTSPERKPGYQQQSSTRPDKQIDKHPKDTSPTRSNVSPDRKPGVMKPTIAKTSKYEVEATDDIQKTVSSKTIEHTSKTDTEKQKSYPEHPRHVSPSRPSYPKDRESVSPERKPEHRQPTPNKAIPEKKPGDKYPKDTSPELPGYMRTTTAISSKHDTSTTENIQESAKVTSKSVETKHLTSKTSDLPTHKTSKPSDEQPKTTSHPRTTSPSKLRPQNLSPDRKPSKDKLTENYLKDLSPTKSKPETPGYMKTTVSAVSRHDTSISEDLQETVTSTTETKYKSIRQAPRPTDHHQTTPSSETPRTVSPSRPADGSQKKQDISPERKPSFKQPASQTKDVPARKPEEKHTKDTPAKAQNIPGYMKTTTSVSSKFDSITTSEDLEDFVTSEVVETEYRPSSPGHKVSKPSGDQEYPRTVSPTRPKHPTDISPKKQAPKEDPEYQQPSSPTKTTPGIKPVDKHPKDSTPSKPGNGPDRKPGYMRPTAAVTSKYETITTEDDIKEITTSKIINDRYPSPRSTVSPSRTAPKEPSYTCKPGSPTKEPEELRHIRTPSPTKKDYKVTEVNTDFISFEREQEVLDRVQKSLRRLSPERNQRSPSRERSPSKTTTSLQDIDITTTETNKYTSDDFTETTEEEITSTVDVTRPPKDDKPKDPKVSSKPPSRNVSPTKKTTPLNASKVDKTPESPTKSRSISPKKPISERPQSPQVQRASGIKPREPVPSHLTRKPTPATLTPSKIEKLVSSDVRKTVGVTKQNNFTKTTTTKTTSKTIPSPTGRTNEPEPRRASTPKGVKDNTSPRKEIGTRVTRTSSDITIKIKNTSPQRMKSKPEIKVNDVTTTRTTTTTSKIHRPITKEPHAKLPSKSATALNTSTDDDDDVIIDVQQSKSSRENSPDRICPTPINFGDDVGTPRFPDEVSEPDDEYQKRSYHTIHETESIVDDIVEICEEDELFVKKTEDHILEEDESLLSVNDKVSRFTNKIETVNKPKDTTTAFKDTERRVHSDFVEKNLKSDECLLSVSEKVNKFAKGPRGTKDSRSPSRKIVEEYDKDTIYQDNYTKLSVNDKAHLFVETAENIKTPKVKPVQKMERPDLTTVDDSLKTDDCLLSVSDKVSKFVKTAEQLFTESQEVEEKERKIKEQHDKIMRKIVDIDDAETYDSKTTVISDRIEKPDRQTFEQPEEELESFTKETTSSHAKVRDNPNLKPTERAPAVKMTTLRSSVAVKKAKAMFENIASTSKKSKETVPSKTTKLTDIGVMKKSPKTDSTTALHPSVENGSPYITDVDSEVDAPHVRERPSSGTLTKPLQDDKPRSSPTRLTTTQSPEVPRSKSPMRHTVEMSTTKTVVSRFQVDRPESPKHRPEDKPDKIPGYLRPTKTSQIKEEPRIADESEVSSRRGSGKFGVELRRASVDRAGASSERRASLDQPCIEDIFDLDLLEQMLEKVVGYEQRRHIRTQIRVAKKKVEDQQITRTTKKITESVPKNRSPERKKQISPERAPKSTPQKTLSPDRQSKPAQKNLPERSQSKEHSQPREHIEPVLNGHSKEPSKTLTDKRLPHSPEKAAPKSAPNTRSPVRQPSPDKKTRTQSPNKTTPKPKSNRFSEYASAYMKRVGLKDADKVKFSETKTKQAPADDHQTSKHVVEHITMEEHSTSSSKTFTERTSSKDVIEIVPVNGKRSPSPEKRQSPERKIHSPERKAHSPDRKAHNPERNAYSPERRAHSPVRKAQSPERLHQRTPTPDFKRQKSNDATKKETIIKTIHDNEKKSLPKPVQEEKPSWVTNRNLKKITSESRTFSTKKIEEKPKYRVPSPSKVISKPTDVITSSYGPGPRDADGKPLFGIKALRNGATNYQVKGTVIQQEFHSCNGSAPVGSVSVTAYSSQPDQLERLLRDQGGPAPASRLHGLSAITTTKKFGGDTGVTIADVCTKEERASLEQFTHSDRRVIDSKIENFLDDKSFEATEVFEENLIPIEYRREERVGDTQRTRSVRRDDKLDTKRGQRVEERRDRMEKREDKKMVRQSSVKSLTEKYIKSASESNKSERTTYPKAGLILRTATMKDSVSSDSSAHAGLGRTDSEHSLCSVDDVTTVTTTREVGGGGGAGLRTTTTTTRHTHGHGHGGHTTHTTHGQVRGQEKSFLDSTTKVTGVQDILTRMKNADIVVQQGDSSEDAEARALLNKFLGASVLMAGMQGYVHAHASADNVSLREETVHSSSSGGGKVTSSRTVEEFDLEQCWDERVLRKLLDECSDYEQRRRLRTRLRTLMAEQEACASAVTEALAAAGETTPTADGTTAREEEEVTVTSSVRRNSSEKTVSSSTTTKTSKVIESMTRPAPKPVSPFAKFRQLEKQNSTNSPNSPKTPQSPGSPSQPYFKFTDPALQASALTIKERLLQWCRDKTRDYENVKLENFSTSWADGLAFCALVHHFLPDAFDYSTLTPDKRRHNFTLAFKIADEKAGIYPLLDVDDMVSMRKPDWKCVFTYVQSIHRRFKDHE